MFYVGTSLLVAYYCPEPLSEKAETFLTSHSPLAVSTATELEIGPWPLRHLSTLP
jgi:hypothetical protein